MKPMNRCGWLVRIQCAASVVFLLGFGGSGRGGEASEPVLWDSPAPAPAGKTVAPVPAGKTVASVPAVASEAPSPKRELENARARAAELEKALAQEQKRREKAMDDLLSAVKQINAGREETAQLRKQLKENEKAAAQSRELGKMLEKKTAEWTERGRQLEAVRADQTLLQEQVDGLQKLSASVPALTEKAKQAQTEVDRLRRVLEETESRSKASAQALGKQVQLQQQASATQRASEARAKSLERALAEEKARVAAALDQQKAEQSKASLAKETQGRKDLAVLREGLAEKERTLAETGKQLEQARAELAAAQKQLQSKSAAEARAKLLEQEGARNSARAQALDKALADLRESMAGKENELVRSGEQTRQLQTELAAMKSKGQAEAEAAAAVQKRQQDELAALRQQANRPVVDVAALKKENESQAQQLELKERQHAQLIVKFQQLQQAQEARAQELDKVRAQLGKAEREAEEQKQNAAAEQLRLRAEMKEEELIRQGKALREQLGPADNPALVGSLNDAGLVLQAEGKLDEAERMYRRALGVLDLTSGRSGASAGTIFQHLAEVAWARNDLAAAASHYEEAAQRFSSALGDTHPRHAAALNGWARVRRDQQRPEEAEELYRMAIHIYERNQARHPADLVVPLHNLALLLMEQGRLDEAGTLLERAVTLAKSSDMKKSDELVVMRTMVRYCRATGDLERAEKFDSEVNELAVKALM